MPSFQRFAVITLLVSIWVNLSEVFRLLFWLGLYNMRLTTLAAAAIALPLAWLEMVIAAMLTLWIEPVATTGCDDLD